MGGAGFKTLIHTWYFSALVVAVDCGAILSALQEHLRSAFQQKCFGTAQGLLEHKVKWFCKAVWRTALTSGPVFNSPGSGVMAPSSEFILQKSLWKIPLLLTHGEVRERFVSLWSVVSKAATLERRKWEDSLDGI